jgi:ribosomal protein L9
MRRIITAICLLAAFTANAQTNESLKTQADGLKQQMESNRKKIDSSMNALQKRLDSQHTAQIKMEAARNGEMILRWHNERQAKQKKQMFLYLGMGIFFLVVLIFGLMRKKKKV